MYYFVSIFNQWNQADQRYPIYSPPNKMYSDTPTCSSQVFMFSQFTLLSLHHYPYSITHYKYHLFVFEFLARCSINPCRMNFQWYSHKDLIMYNTYISIYFLFSIYYMPDTSIVLYMSHVFNPYNSPTNLVLLQQSYKFGYFKMRKLRLGWVS